MSKKIKKVLATVACMALACVSFVGCAGEPAWWTDVKDWFKGDKETSSPVEDESGEDESGEEDEGSEEEGEKESGDETTSEE